ncbi:LysR substrate-binding domain-containing protein [Neptuniibacter halophilus]|uniref:LysR substrate-binding domain-containing protein n=1 Tax=Neptuniibacter halophilus TaxID=651666 RepID=UPI002573EB33|nr:LysR substrate-binding domain-containing protein [Neptuniibacter halophilus]
MRNFRKKLPPLDTLIAFEAAARHLSFTQASKELHLTQAAVSQQIRSLEEYLGEQLFIREHRSVSLTQQGRDYQHTVVAALTQLANATLDIRVVDRESTLTVAADQSIASLWLMPRLGEFRERYPEVKLRLVSSDLVDDCLNRNVDVALFFGEGRWRGYESLRIFRETVYPICSEAYIRQHGPINGVEELIHHHLIELEDLNWNSLNWRRWLNAKQVDLPVERLGLSLTSYPLVIDAARNGQGIALGWKHLISAETEHEVPLLNPVGESVETDFGYYLIWHKERKLSQEATAFIEWIREHLETC